MTTSWTLLKRWTQARVGLGRAGHALPTKALLDFQIAHARARDAVHIDWDIDAFEKSLKRNGAAETLVLQSNIENRTQYLLRPDRDRQLHPQSRDQLKRLAEGKDYDITLIVTNGLSSLALNNHGLNFLSDLLSCLEELGLAMSPLCLLKNARVAIADEIGEIFKSQISLIVVGERPGLSVPDSLGLYLTFDPRWGRTDADRNCLSNIRQPDGLSYREAANKTLYLVREALQKKLSGVDLKDEMNHPTQELPLAFRSSQKPPI